MPARCLLYYITDRKAFPGDEFERCWHLLQKIGEVARAGVDYIQLREKDLSARELESLAKEAMGVVDALRTENPELKAALLINSRIDVALAAEADGVHLRSDDVSPPEVRSVWESAAVSPTLRKTGRAGQPQLDSLRKPVIGVSCHSPAEVIQAAANGADFAVFAPVFEKVTREKKDTPGVQPAGLAQLEQACRANIPVLALGGVNLENTSSCLEAGAAGIAAIRLFQENDIAAVVRELRA